MDDLLQYLNNNPIIGLSASIGAWLFSFINNKLFILTLLQDISLIVGIVLGVLTIFIKLYDFFTRLKEKQKEKGENKNENRDENENKN
jgi:predicted membrane protein